MAPLWARFYEIGTNRPIFGDGDGLVRHALSEIGEQQVGRSRLPDSEDRNGISFLDEHLRTN